MKCHKCFYEYHLRFNFCPDCGYKTPTDNNFEKVDSSPVTQEYSQTSDVALPPNFDGGINADKINPKQTSNGQHVKKTNNEEDSLSSVKSDESVVKTMLEDIPASSTHLNDETSLEITKSQQQADVKTRIENNASSKSLSTSSKTSADPVSIFVNPDKDIYDSESIHPCSKKSSSLEKLTGETTLNNVTNPDAMPSEETDIHSIELSSDLCSSNEKLKSSEDNFDSDKMTSADQLDSSENYQALRMQTRSLTSQRKVEPEVTQSESLPGEESIDDADLENGCDMSSSVDVQNGMSTDDVHPLKIDCDDNEFKQKICPNDDENEDDTGTQHGDDNKNDTQNGNTNKNDSQNGNENKNFSQKGVKNKHDSQKGDKSENGMSTDPLKTDCDDKGDENKDDTGTQNGNENKDDTGTQNADENKNDTQDGNKNKNDSQKGDKSENGMSTDPLKTDCDDKGDENKDDTGTQNGDENKDDTGTQNGNENKDDTGTQHADENKNDTQNGNKNKNYSQKGDKSENGKKKAKSKTKKKSKSVTTKMPNDEEKESIFFHVLVSNSFQVDPNIDDVFIKFEPTVLGGWNSDLHKMKFINKTETHTEYEKSVWISKYLIKKTFVYKYMIKNGKSQNCEHEFVYYLKKRTKNPKPNRTFKIPANLQYKGDWHQYDGFCYHKEEMTIWDKWTGKLKRILTNSSDLNDSLKADVDLAAKHFLDPLVQNIVNCNKEDVLQMIEINNRVHMVLHNILLQVSSSSGDVDDDACRTLAFSLVIQPILDYLTACDRNNKTVMMAVFVVLLTNKYNMKLKLENKSIVHRNLMVQVDWKEKKCHTYEFIEENFDKKLICDAVVKFMKINRSDVDQECDSSWLYAVSLVHFLCGEVQPFQKPVSAMHNCAEWWCYKEFEKRKDVLKRCIWHISVDVIIEELSPLFHVDYLLPRTIVAALNEFHVLEVIQKQLVPPDICCATLHFHLNSWRGSFVNNDKIQTWISCLKSIAQMILQKSQENAILQSSEEEKEKDILLNIVLDMVELGITVYSTVLLNDFLMVFFEVFNYVIVLDKTPTATKYYDEFRFVSANIIQMYVLRNKNEYLTMNCKDVLEKLNNLMGYNNLHQSIQDIWNSVVSDHLKRFLDQLTSNMCLDIYGSDDTDEKYCSVIQESLSEKAFIAFDTLIQVYLYFTIFLVKFICSIIIV